MLEGVAGAEEGEGRGVLFAFAERNAGGGAEEPEVLGKEVAGSEWQRQTVLALLLAAVQKGSDIHVVIIIEEPSAGFPHGRSWHGMEYDRFWALIIINLA